jgi:hypothetical protein
MYSLGTVDGVYDGFTVPPMDHAPEKATDFVRISRSAKGLLHRLKHLPIPKQTVGSRIEVLLWWATEHPAEWDRIVAEWLRSRLPDAEAQGGPFRGQAPVSQSHTPGADNRRERSGKTRRRRIA